MLVPRRSTATLCFLFVLLLSSLLAEPLHDQLLREGVEGLAKAARAEGDARRGAAVFYQPQIACTSCHSAGEDAGRLGPDLAKAGKEATDTYLVESILFPSKIIKKGFETV